MRTPATTRRSFGVTQTAQNCIRTPIITLAVTRNSMEPRSSVCGKKILARLNISAGLRRPGRSRTARSSLITPKPRAFIMSMVLSVRIQPSHNEAAHIPYSAISHEPRIQQLSDDFARLGLKPFHTPLGVMLDQRNRQNSPCIRCSTCDGFPCLVNAKADAHICCVVPALRYNNVTLVTDAKVTRLETDGSGREVTRVEIERNGGKETFSGKIVVLSAGAINSAALLLRSASDKHPNGLANGSDVVGRHYMGHVNSVLMALAKCPNPTVFQKTLSVNDFYFSSL